ncbi:hypothetical protein [Haloarchaeobius litoreus]|uniref:Cobalt/nickel transport protein n=1 Tax=Haloarchaeobius litoreus TaxID=755306 RepID=A0ABD6DKC2_9EURY|nr:hypothetical protein [Haloarchaeobius litoreus]
MRTRRIALAGLVVLGLLVVAGVGGTVAAQDGANVADVVDRTERVAELESLADRSLLQYLGGGGIGLGLGIVLGSVVVYRIQKSRIDETYE